MGSHRLWGPIISDKADQLRAHPQAAESIKLLCVVCEGFDPEDQLDHLQQSLYGIRAITHRASPQAPPESVLDLAFDRPIASRCYYFAPSLFAQRKTILSGVLVQVNGEWQLLVNSVASDYARLLQTRLYRASKANGAVLDPNDPDTIDPDDFMISPRRHAESNQSALDRLAEKYKLKKPAAMAIPRHRIIARH